MTTMILLFVFASSTILVTLVSTGLLWLGTRWAKIPAVSLRRALAATLLGAVPGIAAQVTILAGDWENHAPLLALVLLLAAFVATWMIVQRVLRTSFGRTVWAWLPTLASLPVALALALLIKDGLGIEAYYIPTNAMAPSLVGEHFDGLCPGCSGRMIVPADGIARLFSAEAELGICTACLQADWIVVKKQPVRSGDRAIAMRFLEPRRWDLLVFRYPAEPTVVYAQRLVGLPGEEVALRDGEVIVNGEALRKPAEIAALRYVADPSDERQTQWGPIRLAADEYFVLGDFSASSSDSRFWHEGAAGRPAYAVPRDHLLGVITHCYYPFSRWRVFR